MRESDIGAGRSGHEMAEMTTTKPKPFCFVLMPFDSKFDDVYQLGIKEACAKAGAYCERVDEQIYQETILERIYNQIAKADFIVADMTGRNPNVFYEVGYAHALGKPTVLLTQNSDDIPFDLKHFPHIVYENRILDLQKELTRRVEWFVTNPCEKGSERIDIELYVGSENLSSGMVTLEAQGELMLTLHNASSKTFEAGDVKVGIISSHPHVLEDRSANSLLEVPLPDGRTLLMMRDFPVLFPGSFASRGLYLFGLSTNAHSDISMLFRVFTRAGTREYPLQLHAKAQ
jgi:hypothetical protein